MTAFAPRAASHSEQPGSDRVARDHRLFARYRDGAGTPTGRDEVVARFLPLARQLAARYARPPEPFDDVYQVACMALVKAVDRYDPGRAVTFSSYAVPTIVGEIKRYYRDHTWVVHVPRDLAELSVRVQRTTDDLASRSGRPATVPEIAAALDVGDDDVRQARDAIRARRPTSLDAHGDDDDDTRPGSPSPTASRIPVTSAPSSACSSRSCCDTCRPATARRSASTSRATSRRPTSASAWASARCRSRGSWPGRSRACATSPKSSISPGVRMPRWRRDG